VRVMPWRTMRFNECVCAPYNADFDGDEMNMHVPQTEEARAEAIELMGVQNNLVTPGDGSLVVAPTQDFLSAVYMLSRKSMFYDRSQFCQMCSWFNDAAEHIDLPPPAIIKPVELWTGKQLWGVMIRPQKTTNLFISYTVKTKIASKYKPNPKSRFQDLTEEPVLGSRETSDIMEEDDGWVIFQNSELLCGTLNKQVMGGGKKSMLYVLLRTYGPAVAGQCMNRIAKVSARFLGNQGFSIGIGDVTPSPQLEIDKAAVIQKGFDDVTKFGEQFKAGQIEALPGMTAAKTLEKKVQDRLSSIRNEAGAACVASLDALNAPRIMERSGSKGSDINIAQMVALVGQQVVSGNRIPEEFVDRTLPHFQIKAQEPAARGFVRNSFYSGLEPTEFFFHTMTGREGLVDTAVKTADTGYMQRRLTKAMEDLAIKYDGSCRNSCGDMIQFVYGDDGLDPTDLDDAQTGVDFSRVLIHCFARFPKEADEPPAVASYIERKVAQIMDNYLRKPGAGALESGAADWASRVEKFLRLQQIAIDIGSMCNEEMIDYSTKSTLEAEQKKLQGELDALAEQKVWHEGQCPEGLRQVHALLLKQKGFITKRQLDNFIKTLDRRLGRAVIEPGTACGALGAQSIGEPGTQMTLKTFHFAGVASMNVTMGVPRIKEIINAAKTVSTPIIDVALECGENETSAKIVNGRIGKVFLSEIAEYIQEVYQPGMCSVVVKIDFEIIRARALELTTEQVQKAIVSMPKLPKHIGKLSAKNIVVDGAETIRIFPTRLGRDHMLADLQYLKKRLPGIIVHGIPEIARTVITRENEKWKILASGQAMLNVMGIPGVDGRKTFSTHIMEVEECLGIEAARTLIISEMRKIFGAYGIGIDIRHFNLLADTMTYRGEVLGINRFGIEKMRDSVLMLASFEKTVDHLFDASGKGRVDAIDGVSERIIMGITVPLGTGFFKLLHRVHGNKPPTRGAPLLLQRPQLPGLRMLFNIE